MDKTALLDALRNEVALLEARAKGAKEAYKIEWMKQAREELGYLACGEVVSITYQNSVVKAEITKMAYSTFDFEGYEGPAFYGYCFLKSGKKSKVVSALFTPGMWRAKLVVLVLPNVI